MRSRGRVDAVRRVPPERDAPGREKLRWVRRMYDRRWLPILVAAIAHEQRRPPAR